MQADELKKLIETGVAGAEVMVQGSRVETVRRRRSGGNP